MKPIEPKKRKHPEKRKKATTQRKPNFKMSTIEGAQLLHLACRGAARPLAPQSVTPLSEVSGLWMLTGAST